MFHLRDNLFFIREPNGSVTIEKYTSDQALVFRMTIDPEQWASVVSSMSRLGETHETFLKALSDQVP